MSMIIFAYRNSALMLFINMYKHFGEKIRDIRKNRGISQAEMAEHLGITYQAYQYCERTGNFDIHKIYKIASVLESDYDNLLNLQNEFSENNKIKTPTVIKTFGQLLRDVLDARDISMADLAKMDVGVSAAQISHLATDRRVPSLSALQKIASILEVPIGYFFNEVSLEEALKLKDKEELDPKYIKLINILKELDDEGVDEIIKQAEKEKVVQAYLKKTSTVKKSS